MGGINDILRLNTSERPIVVTAPKENLIDFSMKIVHLLTNRKEADTIRENAYIVSKETFGMESVVPKLIYAYKGVLNV